MQQDNFDAWRMNLSQLEAYVASVERARAAFPEMMIRLALEVDYLPGQEPWIRELAGRFPWDYFIGSVHYLDSGWDIDNPTKLSEWEHRDTNEVWMAYVERLEQAAESRLFDILGHIDLPKKFGHRPDIDVVPRYERLFGVVQKVGMAIELNTAGLRKDCAEIYPSEAILEAAFRKGVPITFGSDAHAPEEVGCDFDRAVELAKSVGYLAACRFVGRKRTELPFAGP